MKCTNPKLKEWLYLYYLDLLAAEQKIPVEAHLMECQACFEELYHMTPILEILEEMPEEFSGALQSRGTIISQAKKYLIEKLESLLQSITWIASELIGRWQIALKVLVPLTLAVLIAVFIISEPPVQYSDLAIVEKAPYLALRLRQPGEINQATKIFDEALSHYEFNNYDLAIQKLHIFLKQDSQNANGHFYLGVCLLLTEQVTPAINNLILASQLSQHQGNQVLLEKCYWYLGNAYLQRNQAKKALVVFHKIAKLEKDFKEKAENQIANIENKMNKKTKK